MGLLIRSVGTYAQLPAASAVPAGTVIQVGNDPNTALNGLYRTNGSTWSSATGSSSPTGSAGGVLAYAGSTYPNPSGLRASDYPIGSPKGFVRLATAMHPISGPVYTEFKLDDTDNTAGATLGFKSGNAAQGSWANPVPGGNCVLEAGSGAPGFIGGNGGHVELYGGNAGGGAGGGYANDGGDVVMTPGAPTGAGRPGSITANGRMRALNRVCLSKAPTHESVGNGSKIGVGGSGVNGLRYVIQELQHAGAGCTLDATEPIAALGAVDAGAQLLLYNGGSGTIEIPAGGNVLVENGVNLVISPNELAWFLWVWDPAAASGLWVQTTPKMQVG